ncbi:two-component response regulator-like APRR1 [Impatiens glandulifera]|uniref:two-component response regulator-like APRR1 n=1 Tax=Impatiens glandulifera TaxID=253017 RepID=UPI001FB09890|nr:two-component response regulator-like APRR1 [Impatiens glandulifera]
MYSSFSSHHLSALDCSFFPDPFLPFNNDLILSLQETPEINYHHQYDLFNPVDKIHLEDYSTTFFNSSPPTHLMENLSLSAFETINGGTENGWMVPTSLLEYGRKIRRTCSTGDLQMKGNDDAEKRHSWSPVTMEEGSFKMGRCGAEERKKKIQKYRAKRMHRNFNKTIKYVCRMTLANKRPRIRGRFARHNEATNVPSSIQFNNNEIDEFDEETLERGIVGVEELGVQRI